MRINRYLAKQGIATRKEADRLIAAGRVFVNDRRAVLGERVTADDRISLDQPKEHLKENVYFAYYKPRGIVTHSPQGNARAIVEREGESVLFPIGRLDKTSEGLIILTNDGRVTERLLHPRFEHEKEYLVTVRERVLKETIHLLEQGITSEGEFLRAKKVSIIASRKLSIILTQGKKHQIRRMLSAVHLTVENLTRIRIMGVHLGNLVPGERRKLAGTAKVRFLAELDLR